MKTTQFRMEPKLIAAELWLQREISETKLKKVLTKEEIKDLKFGKRWMKKCLESTLER